MTFPIHPSCRGVKKIAMNRGLTALVALVAIVFSCLVEAGLDEGIAAMQSNNYQAAFQEFQPLADQGVAEAQFLLGNMYADGLGVTEDPARALSLYRLAAEQGLAHAQLSLGDAYFLAIGVPEDFSEAVNWYRRAAEQGHPQAQFNLASMYSAGQGIKQDNILAYIWCSVSAKSTPNGEAVRRCDRIAPRMTKDEIARAKEQASKFVPKQGHILHPLFKLVP